MNLSPAESLTESLFLKVDSMRLVWLTVLLVAVSEMAIASKYWEFLPLGNCDSGDQAVCLVSLYFTEHK